MVILRTYSELVAVVQEIDKVNELKPAIVNIEFTEDVQEEKKAQSYLILLSKVSGYQQETRRRVQESQQPVYRYDRSGLSEIKAKLDLHNKAGAIRHDDTLGNPAVAEVAQKIDAEVPQKDFGDAPARKNGNENVAKARENELMLKPGLKIESIKAAANNELKALVQNIKEHQDVHNVQVEPTKDGLVLLKLSVGDQVGELQKILEGVAGREFDAGQMNIIVSEVRGLAEYVNTAEGKSAASKSDARLVEVRDRLVSDLVMKIGDGNHVGQ